MKLTKPIVFFDLETTGLDVSNDRIVSIAVYKIFPDGTFEEKTSLINPEMPIPKAATEVHKITDEMVKDAPTFKQISKSLLDFFSGCDVAGYNNNLFDNPMLVEEFTEAGLDFPEEGTISIDVGVLFKIFEPRTLQAAVKFYCNEDFKEEAHNSQNDTRATVKVFMAMLERKQESLSGLKYTDLDNKTANEIHKDCLLNENTVDFLRKITIDADGDYCFNFGKEKGRKIKNCKDYASWVLKNNFPKSTKSYIKKALNLE